MPEDPVSYSFRLPEDRPISVEDFIKYLDVVNFSLMIHYERERIRFGLWKDYPATDQAGAIKVKVDRIIRSLERQPEPSTEMVTATTEEFQDIINYAIFGARKLGGE
jgi:hypothetical protein